MLTVFAIIAVLALIAVILSAMGKAPIWVSVLLLCVLELVRALPLGR
jgi:hypothetical protein